MIKLESKNNYLFVTLATGNVYSGLSTNFEFQQDGANFDLVFKNNIIVNDTPFSGFSDETNTPFASVEAFKDFYSASSGTISPALTNEELRASAVPVSVSNQLSLSTLETNTTGSAKESKQDLTNSKLDTLNAKDFSTSAKQDLLLTEVKAKTTTTATTTLATTTTSQSAISSNANRRKVIFENSGTQRIFLKYGSTSSSASYTVSLGANEKHIESNFNGQVFANTGAGTSNLQVTELTI